jgi:hypothetical protein
MGSSTKAFWKLDVKRNTEIARAYAPYSATLSMRARRIETKKLLPDTIA